MLRPTFTVVHLAMLACLAGVPAGSAGAAARSEAVWIWGPGAEGNPDEYRLFRGRLDLAGPVAGGVIKVLADNSYQIWVNGHRIGSGPERGMPGGIGMDRFIAANLVEGPNTVAVLVHHAVGGNGGGVPGRGGLILQMDWVDKTHRASFITDENWKTLKPPAWLEGAPAMGGTRGYYEWFDARKWSDSWTATWYDDSLWEDSEPVGPPPPPISPPPVGAASLGHAVAVPARLVRGGLLRTGTDGEYGVPHPRAIKDEGGGAFVARPVEGEDATYAVVDFGREVVGSPRLEIDGGPGATIDLAYAEYDGPGAWNPVPGRFIGDRYICRDGFQEWRTMELRGFRYVRLAFRGLQASLRFRLTAAEQTGRSEAAVRFTSSDKRLNEVWKLCERTMELCSLDTLVSGPQGQAVVATDFRVMALAHYVTSYDQALPRRGLRLLAQGAGEDGRLPGASPENPGLISDEGGLAWVQALADWTLYRGERDLAVELMPTVRLVLGWYAKLKGEDGLLVGSPSRIWLDREGKGQDRLVRDCGGVSAALNAYYADALEGAGFIAETLGIPSEAAGYREAAGAVRKPLAERLWRSDEKAWADCLAFDGTLMGTSQQSNLLVLRWGLPPADRAKSALARVMGQEDGREAGWSLVGSPQFLFHYLAVLASRGRAAEGLRMVSSRYGELLKRGATCVWEAWDSGPGRSLCHGAGAHPLFYIATEVLGVKPVLGSPGRIRIAPLTGSLARADGVVATAWGPIEVSWRRGERLVVAVAVPRGVEAETVIPLEGTSRPVLRRNGKVVWREGGAAAEGVTAGKENVTVKLAPGIRQEFELM